MTLYDMTVQSAVHQHRALYVHLVAYLKQTEVSTIQRLLHGGHYILVALDAHHRQTNAVMGHALVDLQLIDKRAGQREIYILPVFLDRYNGSKPIDFSIGSCGIFRLLIRQTTCQ